MGRLKFFLPVAMFAVIVALFLKGLESDPSIVRSPFIGKPAPAFDLPRLLLPEEHLTDEVFKGQVSLFNVWASWCPGCASEHELLMAIGTQSDVPIYGLNWKDEHPAALKWLQDRGNPYQAVAVDPDNIAGIDWGVYGAPETFLIDTNGIILYKLVGPLTAQVWVDEFMPRISKARGHSPNGDSL